MKRIIAILLFLVAGGVIGSEASDSKGDRERGKGVWPREEGETSGREERGMKEEREERRVF